MLDQLDFALRDFRNRKFQPLLAFSGLLICVASTTFLLLLGQSLGFNFSFGAGSRFKWGLSAIASAYVSFNSILVFLIGMFVVLFLFSSVMADRIRDVGLIKSLGYNLEIGYSYLVAGPLLIVVLGCLGGGVVGLAAFAVYATIFLQLGFLQWMGSIFIFAGILVVSFFGAWIIVSRQVETAYRHTSLSLMPGDVANFDFKKEKLEGFKKFIERFPFSLQIVIKSMLRSRSKSKTTIFCLVACFFLMSVSFVGGFVAWYTTRNYAERAFESNTLVIGNNFLIDEYVELLSPNLIAKDKPVEVFNFLASQYLIDDEFLSDLGSVPGVDLVDTRLVVFANVSEIQTIFIRVDENNNPHYELVGRSESRSTCSLLVGLNLNHLVGSLVTQNDSLKDWNLTSSIVGTYVAGAIFDDPIRQRIEVNSSVSNNSQQLSVIDVALNPLNQGNAVYVPLESLQELNSVDHINIILLVAQKSEETILKINNLAAKNNFKVADLDEIREQNLSSIDGIWTSIMFFPLMSFVTAMICLLNCIFVSVSGRLHDFGIIKAIGAKPNYITKLVFLESLILVLLTAPVGIVCGTIFNFAFLIPQANIPIPIFTISLLTICALLISMCGLSTLIVLRSRKHLPKELLQGTI